MTTTFFWCTFGFGRCFGAASWSNHWAGRHWLLYTVHFLSHITIQSRNGSLGRIREDNTSEGWLFQFPVSSWGSDLSSFFMFPICFKCQMTIEWLSSWATSLVVVRGSASMTALNCLLSTSHGQPLCFSSSRLVSFAKLLEPPLYYTFVSSSWARCVLDVVSCLSCLMTCFELE